MDDKITIIEGPPPTLEAVTDGWVLGLSESPTLADIAITQLRTFNGPALVERCYRAWNNRQSINLEYRTPEGLEHQATIVAARCAEVEEGHLLFLWLRLTDDTIELDFGYDDDVGDEDLDYPDLI